MNSQQKNILRDLGSGLIMRRSTPDDADALSEFNGMIHGENEVDRLRLINWTRDMLTRPHPTFNADDFVIVEESATGRIVSSLNLIPQTWSYEGIEFGVGRPELVGTLPEYRNRGLVRVQFDEIHTWCVERNMPVQVITGIPYFYRQFGYDMALDLDGGRIGYEANFPKLKDDEAESYRLRRALESDIPFIMELYQAAALRNPIFAVRDEAMWKYELVGRSEESITSRHWEIIERMSDHEAVGFLMRPQLSENYAMMYEVKPGVSWLDVTPSVVRHLWGFAQELHTIDPKSRLEFGFFLGGEHPVYQVMGDDLPMVRKPYAYFVRVPDLIGFMRLITPALEKRLASSIAAGHNGELKLSFYKRGIRLQFENGKLVTIEEWKPTPNEWGDAAFPDLTFLQLLFGYRSYAELRQSYADCWCHSNSNRALLEVLFPKKASNVLGIA